MAVRFQLKGDKELERKLKRLSKELVPQVLEQAVLAGAKPIQEQASANAPVRTGTLRDDIQVEVQKKTPTEVAVAIGPGQKAWYGKFVELGTSQAPPHPFLRPAVIHRKKEAFAKFSDEVRKALQRIE